VKRNSYTSLKYIECPIMTPIRVDRKPAYGPSTIPVIGSAMKIQLRQTPDESSGNPINESQMTLRDAKRATRETNKDFFMLVPFLIRYYLKKTPLLQLRKCLGGFE